MSDDGLSRLAVLAQEQVRLEGKVDDAEAALARAKRELADVAERQIPQLMRELGIKEYQTLSGARVSVTKDIWASISDENRPAALAWLRENGFDGLVKNMVSLFFDRAQDGKARKAVTDIKALGLEPEVRESVHPQTLSAFVRRRLAEGEPIPMDLFGVRDREVASVSLPKAK